jgi:hypothetical protein
MNVWTRIRGLVRDLREMRELDDEPRLPGRWGWDPGVPNRNDDPKEDK